MTKPVKKHFNIFIEAEVLKRFKMKAVEMDLKPSHLAEQLINDFLSHPPLVEASNNETTEISHK